ncbi:MAG: TlyA family RNA methyltransferase, partial [Anaeroplasmataceae bacterium]|nr:TlyA family RNA methyltransferase [Anaeroplasmataceae bacterium]
VSRGGYKLAKAIEEFQLDFEDKIVLDIGASTGGFTDCALKNGAKLVYSVDVGTDQLDESLRNKEEVVVLEQTNILEIASLPTQIDFIVMDVSFVSIEKILPAVDRFLTDDNAFVCLINPTFELGKKYFKNGVVKNKNDHLRVLKQVTEALRKYNMGISKLTVSPILGSSGNKEFLAYIKRNVVSQINLLEVCR